MSADLPAATWRLLAGQQHLLAVELLAQPGRPVPVARLLEAANLGSLASLRTQMSQLRKVLGDHAGQLQTIRGYGYRWGGSEVPDVHSFAVAHGPVLDIDGRSVFVGGQHIKLTPYQTGVLRALSRTPGRFVDLPSLQTAAGIATPQSVATHVSMLRRALKPLGPNPIGHARGLGYQYLGPRLRHVGATAPEQARVQLRPDGSLRVNWHLLRLRRTELPILRTLVAHVDEPVSYATLYARIGHMSTNELQSTIASLRGALRPSDVAIVHCGPRSQAYMLVRSP